MPSGGQRHALITRQIVNRSFKGNGPATLRARRGRWKTDRQLGHILGMPAPIFPATTITFEPLPLKVGAEWHVAVTYPDGQKEQIAGLKSEAEAVAWIGSPRCLEWVKARGYQ